MTRTQLTIYADIDAFLVRLAEGWRLCGLAPEPNDAVKKAAMQRPARVDRRSAGCSGRYALPRDIQGDGA